MEQNELIEKMRKLGELIGTISTVVYAQSCFIQVLGQQGGKILDSEQLATASKIHRATIRMAMEGLGPHDKDLDELDKTMEEFEKYRDELAKEEAAFKERRAAINRGEKPPQE